jgi:hypothetical protein
MHAIHGEISKPITALCQKSVGVAETLVYSVAVVLNINQKYSVPVVVPNILLSDGQVTR